MTTISPEGQRRLTELAGMDPDKVTDTKAAIGVAFGLMLGDPETFKAGYTAPNALLAALDVFPEADRLQVEQALGLRCKVCGSLLGDEVGCEENELRGEPVIECNGKVVVIEDRVGNWEFGPYIASGPVILTANDGAELPGQPGSTEGLIAHARERYPEHAVIVVGEEDWSTAAERLDKKEA